jgi:hypothetical protein
LISDCVTTVVGLGSQPRALIREVMQPGIAGTSEGVGNCDSALGEGGQNIRTSLVPRHELYGTGPLLGAEVVVVGAVPDA